MFPNWALIGFAFELISVRRQAQAGRAPHTAFWTWAQENTKVQPTEHSAVVQGKRSKIDVIVFNLYLNTFEFHKYLYLL